MVTEEIGLNEVLEKEGMQVIETDLGEYLLQISGDKPSPYRCACNSQRSSPNPQRFI